MTQCTTCGEYTPAGRDHACVGGQLPDHSNIKKIVRSNAINVSGRLEITLTIKFNDGTPQQLMKMNVTYKKHLMKSYQGNEGYIPKAAADHNTICRVELEEFQVAFENYADHIRRKIWFLGTDIQPNSIVFADQSGIFFTSDVAIAGRDIHCFPCLPPGLTSRIVFDLSSQQFGDMVKLLRFLYHGGDRFYESQQKVSKLSDLPGKHGDAENAFKRQSNTVWFQTMFNNIERKALEIKLQTQKKVHFENSRNVAAMLNKPTFKSPLMKVYKPLGG
jgi:hypothetical protein